MHFQDDDELRYQVWIWHNNHDNAQQLISALKPFSSEVHHAAIEFINKHGGIIYRGVRLTNEEIENGYEIKILESFSTDRRIAEKFGSYSKKPGLKNVMIKLPLKDVASNVLLAVPTFSDPDNGDEETEEFNDEMEIIVHGPMRIKKDDIVFL